MFILQADESIRKHIMCFLGDENNRNKPLCYSEDSEKLIAMVDEFNKQILQQDGSLIAFKNCPETITFGRFVLTKGEVGANVNEFSCEEMVIGHLDTLYVYEVIPA
jgi:hypothetical protein